MRYLDITTVGPDAYTIKVYKNGAGAPVVRAGDKFDFDRRAMGLRVKKTYKAPKADVGIFTKEEAIRACHLIGRYFFDLGDMVWGYTYVDALRNTKFFER